MKSPLSLLTQISSGSPWKITVSNETCCWITPNSSRRGLPSHGTFAPMAHRLRISYGTIDMASSTATDDALSTGGTRNTWDGRKQTQRRIVQRRHLHGDHHGHGLHVLVDLTLNSTDSLDDRASAICPEPWDSSDLFGSSEPVHEPSVLWRVEVLR